MAVLKSKDIEKMEKEEKVKKLKELKLELIKCKVDASKTKIKPKEIRKAIARLITLNKSKIEKQHNK